MEHGPFEDVFPIKKKWDIPASYVSLPEGNIFQRGGKNHQLVLSFPSFGFVHRRNLLQSDRDRLSKYTNYKAVGRPRDLATTNRKKHEKMPCSL